MKKPHLEAFDPKHMDKMAESFVHLPTIRPPETRPAAAQASARAQGKTFSGFAGCH
jgi:hypothetical protein